MRLDIADRFAKIARACGSAIAGEHRGPGAIRCRSNALVGNAMRVRTGG
jgi:hypothetical protein